ncbi:hypothetical protein KXS11_08920 [Plantibacter flavus]|uniref:hypothetical protein n=1 Tax=Plantibacter flavus TaxID=150123 RepID=UPI003F154241
MTNANSPRKRAAPVAIEIITAFTVESVDSRNVGEFAERFEEGVRVALLEMPAMTAYFVQADEHSSTIRLGLRIEGMNPEFVEQRADDVLEEALSHARGDTAGAHPALVRLSSQLVGA